MNLLERLKDKQPLDNYSLEYPVLHEELIEELTNKEFVGQLTISKALDIMFAYSVSSLSEVYDLFNDFENNIMGFTDEIFFKLLDSIKEQEDCQLDNYAVTLKIDGYIIECYKNYEYFNTDCNLFFDSCGSIVFGKYKGMTLTDYQYKLLNDKFDEMRNKWLSNYETALKEEERMYNDDYDVRAEQGLYGYGY